VSLYCGISQTVLHGTSESLEGKRYFFYLVNNFQLFMTLLGMLVCGLNFVKIKYENSEMSFIKIFAIVCVRKNYYCNMNVNFF